MSPRELSRRSVLEASAGALGVVAASGVGSAGEVDAADEVTVGDPAVARSAFEVLGGGVVPSDVELEVLDPSEINPEENRIGPGSLTIIEGLPAPDSEGTDDSFCTSNFLWRSGEFPGEREPPVELPDEAQAGDETLYLGIAGHCLLTTGHVDENARDEDEETEDDVSSTEDVRAYACIDCPFGGFTHGESRAAWNQYVGDDEDNPTIKLVELGDVAYARQADVGGGNAVGNDFGLIEVPDGVPRELIDPAMPRWGGPHETGPIEAGDPLLHYGNSQGGGENIATKGRSGVGQYNDGEAWYAALPISFGDSGSAVQVADEPTSTHEAAGVATHITTGTGRDVGFAGTNVARCREMVERDLDEEIEVVTVDEWEE